MIRDKNPDCNHEIDETTAEITSVNDDSIEVEAVCQRCGYGIYGAPSVSEMTVFEK